MHAWTKNSRPVGHPERQWPRATTNDQSGRRRGIIAAEDSTVLIPVRPGCSPSCRTRLGTGFRHYLSRSSFRSRYPGCFPGLIPGWSPVRIPDSNLVPNLAQIQILALIPDRILARLAPNPILAPIRRLVAASRLVQQSRLFRETSTIQPAA